MHCVDLGESFQTHIYLQNFASIQPRTSPVKSAASRALARGAAPAAPGGPDAEAPLLDPVAAADVVRARSAAAARLQSCSAAE